MSLNPVFTGVCTALVTPFTNDKVDLKALDVLIERQIEAGVPALLLCGTTGEPSTLSDTEWTLVLRHAVERINGRAVVIAGTGSNNLLHTLEKARIAKDLGADAQLCVTPYYNKTTQAGLVAFFTRIADSADLPVILYNVPSRTGLNMLPETVERLSHHANIAGIKEAGGSLSAMAELMRLCRLPLYCGNDEISVSALRLGASGLISVLSNLVPDEVVKLHRDVVLGNIQAAEARHGALKKLTDALFIETSPAPVKEALALCGLCQADVRLPLVRMQTENLHILKTAMQEKGLLNRCNPSSFQAHAAAWDGKSPPFAHNTISASPPVST